MIHSALLGKWLAKRVFRRRDGASGAGAYGEKTRRRPMLEGLENRTLFALTVGPYLTSTPAITLAQQLLLGGGGATGITITGATFVGQDNQAGTFAGLDLSSGNNRLAISDGVILTSGSAQGALGPNDNFPDQGGAADESTSLGTPGDTDLNTLVGINTNDANALIVNFTVDASVQSVLFDFIFGSEEFPDFVGSFNDAFAAYLDGTQISFDTDAEPITVNNNFFQLNNSGVTAAQDPDVAGKIGVTLDIEYDGLTQTIRTQAPLDTGLSSHTIKFVIADASDTALDSGVFLSRFQGSTQIVPGPITDLPQAGVFSFVPNIYNVGEEDGFVTLTILREQGESGIATVDLITADVDATATQDYTPFPLTTITFQDGQTSTTVTIPILNDPNAEGDETFTVQLSNATNAAGINVGTATVNIIDDELGVEFSQSQYVIQEGIDTVQVVITVVLTSSSPVTVTVDFATITGGTATADTDYRPIAGTLTFAPGQTSQTFTVDIFDDYVTEGSILPGQTIPAETVTIELSNPSSPTILGLVRPATLIILDLDRAPGVLDAQFVTNERFINGVALRFSEPMNPPQMEDLLNFDLFLRKESKKLGGSPTRTRVQLVSAVYETTSRTVTLTSAKQLRENKVYEVIVNTTRADGVESVQGDRLDGNYDNIQGDDFTGYLTRATRINYFDDNGDKVGLSLKGPGRLELFRDVERNARQVRLINTSQDTILNGTYQPVAQTDGLAIIDTLLTGTGFRNRLPQPPFKIKETINAAAVPNT